MIQKKLAKKHLKGGSLVLYDITSSYLEGEYKNSDIVRFGYNRDGKKNHEQIVIGLLCNKEGCPVGIEVYPGNTKDETTAIEKINQLKNKYHLDNIIFVGDRGMITKSTLSKIKDDQDVKTITAISRNEIFKLLEANKIQPDLFDENNIHEVIDPDDNKTRYCLCKNPLIKEDNEKQREKLLELTLEKLKEIKNYKRATTIDKLGARIGKALEKYKMGKYIIWNIDPNQNNGNKDDNNSNGVADNNKISKNHKISYQINQDAIDKAKLLDGCYIISSNVDQKEMSGQEIVCNYKRLELVETAFRNLKTVQIEMRPIYHKTDNRIKSHVFLCMLSYYVQWHMKRRLASLFESDGTGKNRKWSFKGVIETLKQITQNKTAANGITFYQNSNPTIQQRKILDLLKVTI